MHRLKLYLDTSAISLLFQDTSPDRQHVTRDFFRNVVEPRRHEAFVSTVVVDEILDTPDERRRTTMLQFVERLELPVLPFDPEDGVVRRLANLYVEHRIIPPGKPEDALHVALATVHEVDALVTWNYRHLAGIEREQRIGLVNLSMNFTKPLRLVTPMEFAIP